MLLLAAACVASAQGVLVPDSVSGGPIAGTGVFIKQTRITCVIEDQIATTRIEQTFANETDRPQEGTYLLPVPEGIAVTDFRMVCDCGQKVEAKLLTKEQAQATYDSIVRKLKDPALLTFSGRAALQTRVFPIPPRGERILTVEYSEVVPCEQGVCLYRAPMTSAKLAPRPLRSVSAVVRLKSDGKVKNIFSPTHMVGIDRRDDSTALVSYEENNVIPDRDFMLYFSLSRDEFGLNFLTHRPAGEDGYFVLMLAPKVELAADEILPRDVVFVLDTSGSMAGSKLAQAKGALEFCLNSLESGDRFSVVSFNTAVAPFAKELKAATAENIASAISFFRNAKACGGTNIDDALTIGLGMFEKCDRAKVLVFLTDGLPTVGETNLQKILDNAASRNPADACVFAFGVGLDVNTHLLDKLSAANHGCSDYVLPADDIEIKVSNFFAKLGCPVMTDAVIDYGDANVYDCYPRRLPDIFRGSQITVFGKYRAGGQFSVRLTGNVNGKKRHYVFVRSLPDRCSRDEFIPRLWATRKIGWLLDQIELHDRSKEVVDELVELSRKYGVMTEYTAFLIDVEGGAARPDLISQALQNMRDATVVQNGAQAVGRAQNRNFLTQNNDAGFNFVVQADGTLMNADRVRNFAGRTFYFRNGRWEDASIAGNEAVSVVENYGDEYFRLNGGQADIGQAQALGGEVLIRVGDRVYHCK